MKRLILTLGALLIVLSVSAPADAKYAVVRWSNGICQVWHDDSMNIWPSEPGWRRVSRVHRTWARADRRLQRLWARKRCA